MSNEWKQEVARKKDWVQTALKNLSRIRPELLGIGIHEIAPEANRGFSLPSSS